MVTTGIVNGQLQRCTLIASTPSNSSGGGLAIGTYRKAICFEGVARWRGGGLGPVQPTPSLCLLDPSQLCLHCHHHPSDTHTYDEGMPWPGRSSRSSSPTKATVHAPSDTVTCHFCNRSYALPSAHHHLRSTSSSSSSISPTTRQTIKGSWSSFQCPNCESWNLRDPATGDFVEDAQLYSDPSLNTAGPPSVRRSRFAKQDDQSAAAPPFCRDCLINQNLQVQLLAGYVPRDANDAQQARLWDNLANYRRSLDERYPLVCANCQGRIEKIIEERDWKAKARTVGGWLKKSAQVQADQNLPFDRRRSHHLRMIWRIKGCLWAAIYVVTLLHSLHINIPLAIPLSILPDTWLSRVVKENIAVIAASSFLLSFWDPTYGERQRYDGNLQIHGVWRWRVSVEGLVELLPVFLSDPLLSTVSPRPSVRSKGRASPYTTFFNFAGSLHKLWHCSTASCRELACLKL